jgi:outer membrane protein OmpA-like peptidoglycan-associated protein
MHARLVSTAFLALGLADVAVLDLVLAPRLAAERASQGTVATLAAPPAPPPRAAPVELPRTIPAPRPEPREPASEPAGAELRFALESTLALDAEAEIARLSRELSARPSRRLLVRGHTDRLGARAYNLALSRRRAEAVVRLLVARGAPADRISIEAVGDAEPVDPAWTAAAWAKNRRVQILWR